MATTKTVKDWPIESSCMSAHIGAWLIEPLWFAQAVAMIKARTFEIVALEPQARRGLYVLGGDGIAHIEIDGPMMKGDSKFGGTSTVRVRRALRTAVRDQDVDGILLHIDSPGGTVAGTADLAAEVRAADKIKPVFGQISDTGASAALWVATQARFLAATETSEVGSIGTVAVVEDTSGEAELAGIKVHVIATGDFKGAFYDGAPVTDEHLAYLRERVESLNEHFLKGISTGRKLSVARVRELADGKVAIAATAQAQGLIDAVQSLDKTSADLAKAIKVEQRESRSTKAARAIRLAEAG